MKYYTHHINLPPLTDVDELITLYVNLFSVYGVIVDGLLGDSYSVGVSNFTHPIEEELKKLFNSFAITKALLENLTSKGTVFLRNIKISSSGVHFTFGLEGSEW